ncbi:hypothetical protein D3C80_1773720 [compost metagenome]
MGAGRSFARLCVRAGHSGGYDGVLAYAAGSGLYSRQQAFWDQSGTYKLHIQQAQREGLGDERAQLRPGG